MYRSTSDQSSFFEPQFLFSEFLPKNDWSDIYRDKIWPMIDEEKFKHLYQEEGGAPNKSIKLKLSLLIFMSWEKLTWRGAEFMLPRRIDWINATCRPLGEEPIDHTTLFKFYQKLENDDAAYQLFTDLTSAFIDECGISIKKQRTDSFFMQGWLSILSRYGLFKETIRTFLMVLRKHQFDLYKKTKDDLSIDYLKGDFDLTEKDKEKARTKTKQMANDLFLLKNAFENHEQIKHYDTFKTLIRVFEQQCDVKEDEKEGLDRETRSEDKQEILSKEIAPDEKRIEGDDLSENGISRNGDGSQPSGDKEAVTRDNTEQQEPLPQIEIREKPQGEKIISSPHNTDAEYTRKRKQRIVGHKGFVTETCDIDNPFQLITDINLERATHSDAKEILEIEHRLSHNNFKPEKMYGDAGFVNGETILESERQGIDLEGPSSGRSQSIENHEKKNRPLDVADFGSSIDNKTKELYVISCPAGHQPKTQKRSDKTGKKLVHFSTEVCSFCKLNPRCPVKIGKRISTLTIDEAQYAGAIRHHRYMEDPDYRKECGVRSGAESLVNEIANSHGARKSKHKTEKRSRLQLLFSGISCNIKRYINYNLNSGQSELTAAKA